MSRQNRGHFSSEFVSPTFIKVGQTFYSINEVRAAEFYPDKKKARITFQPYYHKTISFASSKEDENDVIVDEKYYYSLEKYFLKGAIGENSEVTKRLQELESKEHLE